MRSPRSPLPTFLYGRPSTALIVAASFLLAGILAGCGQKAPAAAPDAGATPPALPVQVIEAKNDTLVDTSEFLSILKSRHSAAINPQVEGQITRIFVKSGDHVNAGAPLLQIDPMKQEAAVSSQDAVRAAQQASVRLAKINQDRAQKLFDAGVISKLDFDNAQTNYETSVAQLKSLEDQLRQQKVELRYYRVSAPMNGIVGDIPVHTGDRVSVTTLLTTIDEPGVLEAYLYVPADRAKDLRVGLPVKLLDDSGVVRTETQITFISPQVDPETQTVLAKAAVGNAKASLRIAQQVRSQIIWGSRQGPVIPVLAVQRINGQSFAFVAVKQDKGSVARQRLLKLGDIYGNNYAVLDGIKPGDHIIISGTQFLQDGAPVIEQLPQATTPPEGAAKPPKKPK